jgi:hypothetical protein
MLLFPFVKEAVLTILPRWPGGRGVMRKLTIRIPA